jgi:type II secretory pathway pseudopilin PulG
MLKKIWKGFSWIEIGAALLLFSIVVLLTLPSFSRFKCLARQSEAKFELMRILAASQLYKTDYGIYPNVQQLMSAGRVKLRKQHYNYEITVSEDKSQIWVTATGKPKSSVENDKWRVDLKKNLENLQDACSRQ